MNMQEITRMTEGLSSVGWTDEQINAFILYLISGDEQDKLRFQNARLPDSSPYKKKRDKQ